MHPTAYLSSSHGCLTGIIKPKTYYRKFLIFSVKLSPHSPHFCSISINGSTIHPLSQKLRNTDSISKAHFKLNPCLPYQLLTNPSHHHHLGQGKTPANYLPVSLLTPPLPSLSHTHIPSTSSHQWSDLLKLKIRCYH